MSSQYQQKLTKGAAVCAISLCVSLGLCGLNIVGASVFSASRTATPVLIATAYVEGAAISLSFLGLVIIGILMLFAAIFGGRGDS
jgi:hypothetical protein